MNEKHHREKTSRLLFQSDLFKAYQDKLKDSKSEESFRKWSYYDDRKLIHGLLILAITASVLFLIIDLALSDLKIEVSLIIIRFITLVLFLSFYQLFITYKSIKAYERIVTAILLITGSQVILSNIYRPVDYFTHVGIDITIIFLCYVSSSMSIIYKACIATLFTLALLCVVFIVKQATYDMSYYSYTLSVVLGNIFGYVLAFMNSRTKRFSYISLMNEKKARDEIRTLKGIIPICSYCKQIRDDEGSWDGLEAYINTHSNAQFSHGVCPDCAVKVLANIKKN